ncbi:cytochrome c oxidase assembly protein [Nitrogeniibacter mangrovi]|uniref:Cytochrome c oxidase assembly protein n=1 Tax=Nitrogeniibacter mangrovi TaxID=2016596 RepID=A0A6C1B541_9RHOO|nr:cytochrome c oxidase assembly protein [Nitrogeniibacter mangrovi]QID18826.1 cytochrome c oxidase assembly protein [Nitrogeniibacter mangrovi]
MDTLQAFLAFLQPWEFSPAVLALCLGAMGLYARGLWRTAAAERPHPARRIAFFTGWTLIYLVMQTQYDYLSQHMFFIHRLQHLVLHHLGPFLIALSAPLATLARGLPDRLGDRVFAPFWRHPITRTLYRWIQNPVLAPVLFVGLIYLWLTPSIHFAAMLSERYYALMNWSMLLDGLLFWSLVLDPRSRRDGALLGFGLRIAIVLLAIPPQILIGSFIGLSQKDLFDVYQVCGRAWAMDAHTDQIWGGLITWIPASMMHVIGALILIGRWMRSDEGPSRRRRLAEANARRSAA